MKKNTFAFLVLGAFLISCGPKTSSVQMSDSSLRGLGQSEVTFSTLKSSILSPKCLSCHSEVSSESRLSAWVVAGNPEQSLLYTEVKSGSMPKGKSPLSGVELEMVYDYIARLKASPPTPTPSPTPTPTPTPTPVPSNLISYAQVKSRVLTPYGCTSCHSVGTEAKLAKWINVSSPASSSFYTYVKNGSMPQGGSRVNAADQAFILQYLKDYSSVH